MTFGGRQPEAGLDRGETGSLGTLVDSFNLAEEMPDGLSPHRAGYDALVAARLFVHLATTATTLEALRGDPPGGGNDETSALF